jgi:hypothetical protein
MSNEHTLWKWLRDLLPPGRYTRIESECSPGFPDVDYTVEGHSGTMELKYGEGKKPLKGKIRRDQYLWIEAEVKAKGVVWLVVEVKNFVYFIHGREVTKYLETLGSFELSAMAQIVVQRRRGNKEDITDVIHRLLTERI